MGRHTLAARADRFGRLLVTMEPGAKFRFTFLYNLGGQYRSVTAELPRPGTADLLQAITDALQDGTAVEDSEPAAADAKAHGVWVAELIKERDELRDECKELLDQVQCLQWDLGALQAQHNLCTEQPSITGRR
ncbi:hypothetical protein ACIP5Y_00800 [Nocardia sp. NPDC088792]|uniref:hypothetical protein n=1 Tax=Nocardia sp. NPDC088792 TaxID=3364332 RepID=UPI0037F25CA5